MAWAFMKHTIVFLLLSWLAATARTAHANDEQASLSLLVDTLAEVDDAAVQRALLRGMLEGLAGRRNVVAPKSWSALSARLDRSADFRVRDMSMQLSQIFGDQKATQRALAILKDRCAELPARRTALRTLMTQHDEEASLFLESLLDEPDLQIDAIRGYAMVENDSAPRLLLERYAKLDPERRRAVVETLATRRSYAQSLLAAVTQGTVPRDEIPAHVARSLNSILGKQFTQVFGSVRPVAKNREKTIAKYKKLITPGALALADASRGRAVFEKTCAKCHLLYGEGGRIGPDLTGSNRADLGYILLNSVDPSYDVADGYKMVEVVTVDGRIVNGVVGEEDGSRLVLKTVEQPEVIVAKEDIDERWISKKSMMPDGQLDLMKTQEVVDLIKYLRTTEQVEIAK